MFLTIDGGRSRILRQHLLGSPPSTLLSVDDGRSQILWRHLPEGPPSTFSSD
jgi:hypothetical protein